MNVFVLCTGRCGSATFVAAARHISNYTAGHESRANFAGHERLNYPSRHIEADNRLSWFLGRLDRAYGRSARYVHLVRDPDKVARSFADRWGTGIIRAYDRDVLMAPQADPVEICRDYIDTVSANIEAFLADKDSMTFRLEQASKVWPTFWEWIGAEGALQASLAEWTVHHNEGPPPEPKPQRSFTQRLYAITRRPSRILHPAPGE